MRKGILAFRSRVAPKMAENWGQQVVIDNRAGAGGVVGTGLVASAAPDGYTLLIHSIAFAVSAALYSNLPFDHFKDLAPVSQIVPSPSVLVVSPPLLDQISADVAKQMASQGEQGKSSTAEEFSRFFRAGVEKYRKIVKLANIRVE